MRKARLTFLLLLLLLGVDQALAELILALAEFGCSFWRDIGQRRRSDWVLCRGESGERARGNRCRVRGGQSAAHARESSPGQHRRGCVRVPGRSKSRGLAGKSNELNDRATASGRMKNGGGESDTNCYVSVCKLRWAALVVREVESPPRASSSWSELPSFFPNLEIVWGKPGPHVDVTVIQS
jgi:hypothetical protein